MLFFVAVEDVAATLAKAEGLGGSIVQPVQHVTGTVASSPTTRATGSASLPTADAAPASEPPGPDGLMAS